MMVGPWPRVLADGTRLDGLDATALADATERLVGEAVAAQVESGMGLITDGLARWPDPDAAVTAALAAGDTGAEGLLVRAWRATAALGAAPTAPTAHGVQVAQVVPGPWTLAIRALGSGAEAGADAADVAARALEIAAALAGELAALAAAGCPVVQVLEPAATAVGADPVARSGFLAAHRRLLEDAGPLHAMLAVVGGSAWEAGADTILGAPYASVLVDLVAGPDNWYLVRAAPGERGIVCGALEAGGGRERRDQAPELAWAANYAASANGRGLARVGLANGSLLGSLAPAEARDALRALGRAAALAALPMDEAVAAGLDPRVQPHPLRRRPAPPAGD